MAIIEGAILPILVVIDYSRAILIVLFKKVVLLYAAVVVYKM
jgi:hypothetical protein